ncbi:hypothetical protein CLV31_111124 [Algoriphagus aquaeductus]|uniref:Uncharacterized protein n=1 Tax=Algoriphagus aquaeductus TaxID=475299 RepID=A0A326RPA8_9BACT|nr:hypothetical protein CLV31_111124 [Algoriphagus aquaeductus]
MVFCESGRKVREKLCENQNTGLKINQFIRINSTYSCFRVDNYPVILFRCQYLYLRGLNFKLHTENIEFVGLGIRTNFASVFLKD